MWSTAKAEPANRSNNEGPKGPSFISHEVRGYSSRGMRMTRIVMCRNKWPEADQQDFKVFAVLEGETDEAAIIRAGEAYSPKDEFYIVEDGTEVLPCPCCGGKAYYNPADHSIRADGRVSCTECYLEVEESHGSETPGTALAKWNRRVK
jgi:hypothetical protein